VEDLPEAAFEAAVAEIAAALRQIHDARLLTASELGVYGHRFQTGWTVPNLCADPALQLRVLLPKGAPYAAARIAVAPAPPVLAWPHLENHGLLCLVSDVASVSITEPASVALTLLDDARKLVNASIAGENIQDFEDEFTSYWERWDRLKGTLNILCDPRGPSRMLTAWYGSNGDYFAETEDALRLWVVNRFDAETVKKMKCWPVPMLWLPRPLRPAEYPATISDLRTALQEDPLRGSLLDKALLQPEPKRKLIVLGMQTRRGVAFAGVQVHKLEGLQNGFRRRPPQALILSRYNAATTTGARAIRFDPSWVHGRDHNPESNLLRGKRVTLIGVGSMGSGVADLVVKAGVGALTLIDPDILASANTSRHLLGTPAVGENKAIAVRQSLAKRFPHLKITPIDKPFGEEEKTVAALCHADLVVSVSGSWPTESMLDAMWSYDAAMPPVVYGWTEPDAAAGHALSLQHGAGCLRCVLNDMGKMRVPVTNWPSSTLLQAPGCGDLFQPYGATELIHIQALVAELALDVLLKRISVSTHRVWIGRRELLDRAGGRWNPAWITAHGDPGTGGQIHNVVFGGACTSCRST
jgi:sulfur-carrier protein adenylyltransferase/sulfurtransferase